METIQLDHHITIKRSSPISLLFQMKMMKSMWQMYLYLRSPPENKSPFLLKGDVTSIEACGDDELLLAWHNFAEFQLLLFYNDPSAPDRAIRKKLTTASNFHFTLMIECFHRCVCLYGAARRTKKRKYKGQAKKLRKVIHSWKKVGNPNVVYYCIFLDAEHAALEGKYDEAESLYKKAIQFVGRSGILHHSALFNEYYSDFLLRQRPSSNFQ